MHFVKAAGLWRCRCYEL